MQEPIEYQPANIIRRVEKLEEAERKWDFTTRDVSYKSDMVQAHFRMLHDGIHDVRVEMNEAKHHLNARMDGIEQRMDKMDEKLDLIIGFLQPKKGE